MYVFVIMFIHPFIVSPPFINRFRKEDSIIVNTNSSTQMYLKINVTTCYRRNITLFFILSIWYIQHNEIFFVNIWLVQIKVYVDFIIKWKKKCSYLISLAFNYSTCFKQVPQNPIKWLYWTLFHFHESSLPYIKKNKDYWSIKQIYILV